MMKIIKRHSMAWKSVICQCSWASMLAMTLLSSLSVSATTVETVPVPQERVKAAWHLLGLLGPDVPADQWEQRVAMGIADPASVPASWLFPLSTIATSVGLEKEAEFLFRLGHYRVMVEISACQRPRDVLGALHSGFGLSVNPALRSNENSALWKRVADYDEMHGHLMPKSCSLTADRWERKRIDQRLIAFPETSHETFAAIGDSEMEKTVMAITDRR